MAVGSFDPDNAKAELFDFETGGWTIVSDYPFGNGVVSNYDMLYVPQLSACFVIGGWTGWDYSATVAKFQNDLWSDAGQLNEARSVSFKF